MPKIVLSFLAPCLILLFYPVTVCAELHGTLTMTTNNVGRWFTKNHNSVALQANIDYQHKSGLYLGSSVSNVDYEDGGQPNSAQVEVIPYVGYSFNITDKWRIDTQVSRYLYDGNLFDHPADYNEFYLFLHYNDILSARISVADDFYNLNNYAIDYELTGRYPVTDSLEFSASAGYAQTKAVLGSNYPYWNMGFTYFYKFIALDLRYMDATETSINHVTESKMHKLYDADLLDATAVFSISIGF